MAARIGMFGGAFDPPHRAHQALAAAAVLQLRLDKLHIVATGQAWHKSRPLSDPDHRLAMAQLAFADIPQALVDAREIERHGPSFSVQTLRELRALYPHGQLFLIIGADQLQGFGQWQQADAILAMAQLVVAQRPGSADVNLAPHAHRRLDCVLDAVSSTQLRRELAQPTQRAAALAALPAAVARYIAHHQLYRSVLDS